MKTLILKLWPYFLIVLTAVVVTQFAKIAMSEKKDKNRIISDMVITNTPGKTFIAKNGLKATKNDVMELKTSELKRIYPKLIKDAKNVSVPARSLQGISEVGTRLSQTVIVKTKDSIVFDTIHLKVFSYRDPWITLTGEIGDSSKVKIESRDSLQTFLYKGDRIKPWLWILSKRKLQQTIINTNPHSQITYDKVVVIEH